MGSRRTNLCVLGRRAPARPAAVTARTGMAWHRVACTEHSGAQPAAAGDAVSSQLPLTVSPGRRCVHLGCGRAHNTSSAPLSALRLSHTSCCRHHRPRRCCRCCCCRRHCCCCTDILKDQWSPALTLKTALLSLQALLASPQPDDPQDAVVANQYRSEFKTYEKTARYWTEAFANPNSEGDEEKIGKLVEMGFDRVAAVRALNAAGGDENAALEALLGS